MQLAENLKHGLGEQGTDTVFLRTFSALVLAELVYHHNKHPFLEEADVRQILEQALAYYLPNGTCAAMFLGLAGLTRQRMALTCSLC